MESHAVVSRMTGIEPSRLRGALLKLLEESQSISLNLVSPPKGYANWRARSIIKEIAAVQSRDTLLEYEQELRNVLSCQEVRRRTKLTNEFLFKECGMMQIAELCRDERKARAIIVDEWSVLVLCPIQFFQLQWDEDSCRRNIRLEWLKVFRTIRLLSDLSSLEMKATAEQKLIQASEALAYEELWQRRLIEVGQEIQYEIVRQSLMKTFQKLHKYATDYIRDYKRLFREEEKDRITLEKYSFFARGVIMRNFESEQLKLMEADVQVLLQIKADTDVEEFEVLAVRDQQRLIQSEMDCRLLVVNDEEERYQRLYAEFVLGWRDVYQRITSNKDLAVMLSSLELFERRCIMDQCRHSRYGIDSIFCEEHRVAEFRQRRLNRFYEEYLNGATAIWQQENEQFTTLKDQVRRFYAAARTLESSKVLFLEEEMCRLQIGGEYLRQLGYLKALSLREKCYAEAVQVIHTLWMHEDAQREEIMFAYQQQCYLIPQEEIRREEYIHRISIETREYIDYVGLYRHHQKLQQRGAVAYVAASLFKEEKACRSRVMENEENLRHDWNRLLLLSEQEHSYKHLVREERLSRFALRDSALEVDERYNRERIIAAYLTTALQYHMDFLACSEAIYRRSIEKSEKGRREFIAESVPYEHLFLRACEVDELSHRLDIVNEAELVIRACAYTHGHDAPVAYCSEELRLHAAALRFLSIEQLCQQQERELVATVEPLHRHQIEEEYFNLFMQMKLCFEEERCRIFMSYTEQCDWDSLRRTSSRVLSRQSDFDQRVVLAEEPVIRLSHREELMNFLQQRSYKRSSDLIQNHREIIRSGISALMEEMYWSRDAILREEAVERYSLYMQMCEAIEWCTESAQEESNGDVSTSFSPLTTAFAVHSVAVVNPMKEQRAHSLLVRHSDEVTWRRVALHPHQVVNVVGRQMEVLVPASVSPLISDHTSPCSGVVFFMLLDKHDKLISTTSLFLQTPEEEDGDGSYFSLEMENHEGRIHVARQICCTSLETMAP